MISQDWVKSFLTIFKFHLADQLIKKCPLQWAYIVIGSIDS